MGKLDMVYESAKEIVIFDLICKKDCEFKVDSRKNNEFVVNS